MKKQSIWAVAAGLLFVIGLTTLIDIVLHAAGAYPPWNQPIGNRDALLAVLYRIGVSICGAWLTARLAPQAPMKHAVALGCIGIVLAGLGAVATWNLGLGPRWYPISLIVLALPQCLAGSFVYTRRQQALEMPAPLSFHQ
jgi:hypothetical protein